MTLKASGSESEVNAISLVDWARWAPSVHNLQPHRLKIVSETEAILCYDPKFLLPVGDPKSDFATAAMGVFTESLSIAAAHYGFAVKKTEIIAKPDHTVEEIKPFARLALLPIERNEPLHRDLLKDRRTDAYGIPLCDYHWIKEGKNWTRLRLGVAPLDE